MTPQVEAASASAARPKSWLRVALLGSLGLGAAFAFVLFAYELVLARVPAHRAALERLVRAQTGLDIRFNELGLRWGWYGPEAVFQSVELDEPGTAEAFLRAPQLVVGFDAWRTLRSGHPEAGRIELVAPDIDFAGAAAHRAAIARSAQLSSGNTAGAAPGAPGLDRVAVLQRWRGGRIDIEGGTLRLPDPSNAANTFSLQLRRASLGRSDDEWNLFGLVFLPDRVGRTARVVLRVSGDLAKPEVLSGSLRFEARRLLFPGCRDFLAGFQDLARYLPRGGTGDLTVDLDFDHGRVVKAAGTVRAGRLVFDAPGAAPASPDAGATPGGAGSVSPFAAGDAAPGTDVLVLNRLRGEWRAARHGSDWRIRVDSLELAKGARFASLTVDTGVAPRPTGPPQRWVRGKLEQAPVESVVAVARWLAPSLDLAGADLDGTAREVAFDWASGRPEGQRLQTSARLEDLAVVPSSQDFTLGGLSARVAGNETQLKVDIQSRAARLELAQSRQYPLENVHVSSTLHIRATPDGWRIATEGFLLEHPLARLTLSGELRGGMAVAGQPPPDPQIAASGSLTGADIPLVERLLGANTAQAFGAVASRLTAGRIENAQFELRGPMRQLPFGSRGGFVGSLSLRDGVLSGGDLWPDASGVDVRIEWHGARIQATIMAAHAGPFQLAAASAEWDAAGENATRLTGHVSGRLEEAIAWLHDHPRLQEYAPDVKDIDASGNAAFDFSVSVPTTGPTEAGQPQVTARVSTVIDGASLQAIAGLPPLERVSGSLVYDGGRVQHSTLTGTWLGGPVVLRVGEHREKGLRVLAVQAQGVLKAQQLAGLANATGTVQGDTTWTGDLTYFSQSNSQPSHWRMRLDSNLLGVASSLPEPFAKGSAAAVPVHLEVTGTDDLARLRASLGERVRGSFALRRRADVGWAVDRGAVRFGAAAVVMPDERVVSIRGRINQFDLPAYALAWQRLRTDSLPGIRAQIVAGRMSVAGRSYDEVNVQAERTEAATELRIDSAGVSGTARWPTPSETSTGRDTAGAGQPAELRLTRLDLPDGRLPTESVGLIAMLAPTAFISVDDLNWRGRSLGRLSAMVGARNDVLVVDDVRLVSNSHDAHGALHCQTGLPTCVMTFTLNSSDVASSLADFGFAPDLAAASASLTGEVQWRPVQDRPWLASLRGTLSLRVADGTLRGWQHPAALSDSLRANPAPSGSAASGSGASDSTVSAIAVASTGAALSGDAAAPPFPLLAVPALVGGLHDPESAGLPLPRRPRELHFARLDADYDLLDGQATTSNLHFDGDAEILMRGRTGLVARDYDEQVWVLRGEERLPAAVRRFGATPRVAAVWLSLRDLLSGSGDTDRSRAVLRLQGSWEDPIVMPAK